MDQSDLKFFIDSAYGFAGFALLILMLASIWRARRAKHTLAKLEREDA